MLASCLQLVSAAPKWTKNQRMQVWIRFRMQTKTGQEVDFGISKVEFAFFWLTNQMNSSGQRWSAILWPKNVFLNSVFLDYFDYEAYSMTMTWACVCVCVRWQVGCMWRCGGVQKVLRRKVQDSLTPSRATQMEICRSASWTVWWERANVASLTGLCIMWVWKIFRKTPPGNLNMYTSSHWHTSHDPTCSSCSG